MKLWGLTGGIGSGKSTVAQMFADLGVAVLNADSTYHRLLLPQGGAPSALALQIAAAFPSVATLRPDGSLDRGPLAALVFADAAARGRLEALTHPAIGAATQQNIQRLRDEGAHHMLYDVPLLFEKGLKLGFEAVFLVYVSAPVQLARLCERDRCSPAQAQARVGAQMSLEDKRAMADYIIDNSGNIDATRQQVAAYGHLFRS